METTVDRKINRAAVLTQEQVDQYRDQGYLIVHNLLTEEEIASFLLNGRKPPADNVNPILRHKEELHYRNITNNERVVDIVTELIGGAPLVVQSMLLDKSESGGKGVSLHQDTHHIETDPNTLIACWIALTDTDGDNGGLCLVPGSHRNGLFSTHQTEDADEHDKWESNLLMRDRGGYEWIKHFYSFEVDGIDRASVKQLTVPKGAGVFFTSLTIHGSYANKSVNRPRVAFATHYVREGTWVFRSDIQDLMPASPQ